MSAVRGPLRAHGRWARLRAAGQLAGRYTLVRALSLAILAALVWYLVSGAVSGYVETELAQGAYYFAALAGLTVLAGIGGRVSLGHGALMAIGAYTTGLLVTNEAWSLAPALAAGTAATALVGFPMGLAATRLQGPYLAGATLALAVGLPGLADKFPHLLGGENGIAVSSPSAPSWLGAGFTLYHWEAWVAGAGALIVLFVLYNVVHSGTGRSWRAVRDDEIAASLCGLRVGVHQTVAFVLSAACAGLAGGLLATIYAQLAAPSAFTIQLSLSLLAGVVIGGVGSLVGAVWGAALLVLLPNWADSLAGSFSANTNVKENLALAIYGVVLIATMLVWPSGIQGALRVAWRWLTGLMASTARGRPHPRRRLDGC